MQLGFYSAYFTDVTPITLVDLDGNRRHTLQDTATHQNMLTSEASQWVLRYELSPIHVVYTQEQQGFGGFVVGMCAVIGGFFTVTSMVESLTRNAFSLFGKAEAQ